MTSKIQVRRGTANQWSTQNPTLSQGEIGFEHDTFRHKIGDGLLAWNDLTYASVLPADLSAYDAAGAAATAEENAKSYADGLIGNLIDSAPGVLDTLNEIATAINDDPAFFTNITSDIATAKTEAISAAETYADGILPSQTNNAGKVLQTNGSSVSWVELPGSLIGPLDITSNNPTTVDSTVLDSFDLIEYTIYIKQGILYRASKVLILTDGSTVNINEYAISEIGGEMNGISVTSSIDGGTNVILQVQLSDGLTNNASIRLIKNLI